MATPRPRIDVEIVRAALSPVAVLDVYGIEYTRRGDELRTRMCPACGERSRDSVCIAAESGAWTDHAHGCAGGVLDLAAGYAGLDIERDFQGVLTLAAELAGVDASASPFDIAARRAEMEAARAERQRQAELERLAIRREAEIKASARWSSLGRIRETRTCRAYLRSRGLDGDRHVREDYARSDLPGNVCVPLWDIDGSALINVVTRIVSEVNTGPKVLGLAGCPTSGTLCGRVADITDNASVIVVEGLIDTLTAIERWPGRVVLGAHGANRMTTIVETVAPIVKAKGGKLVLVPDIDNAGQRAAIEAGEAALAAGLEIDRTLIVLDVSPHKDLNAAHVAGWKS